MQNFAVMDVKFQFDNLRHDITLEETEDSWEKISKALQTFMTVGESGAYETAPSEVVSALKSLHRPITSAMYSERTRLSGTALDLLNSVASGIGRDFDQLMPTFMPALLTVCGRTNKVVINRARATITTIIESAQLASALPYFVQNVKDKSATLRLILAEGTLACLNSCNPPDLEKEPRARDIEAIIRGTARDANPDVRKVSRRIFESYKILLPSRVDSFTAPLSPTMKKYLDVKSTTIISSSKSTSNLRELKLKPSTSTSATTAVTTDRPQGHSRNGSTSTVNSTTAAQSRNLAATLTRVSRREPVVSIPKTAPVRLPPARTTSEAQASELTSTKPTINRPGPSRTVSEPEVKRPLPPMRTVSRPVALGSTNATTATTARRLPVTIESQIVPSLVPAGSSGPRRVPMPPPPPPPPKKEPEVSRRPASRVDNASSTASTGKASTIPQPVASKKPTASQAVHVRERPAATKPPIPKFKPTSKPVPASASAGAGSGVASSSTKPLTAGKAKPQWGRPVAPSKSVAPNPKSSEKNVVKKHSSFVGKPGSRPAASKRPITPAMVALPPSPTPDESKNALVGTKHDDAIIAPTSTQSPRSSPPLPLNEPKVEINSIDNDDDDKEGAIKQMSTPQASPVATYLSTSTNVASEALPIDEEGVEHSGADRQTPTPTDDLPRTPQSNTLLSPMVGTATLATKTPISALLSSIERGFLYSPTTPLSPADAYLPGPNGTINYSHETHAPRIEGPMQPFNYALHTNSHGMNGGLFAAVEHDGSKLVCGDIGVVNVAEHDKLYGGQSGLPLLDETRRAAFSDLNQ